MGIRKFIDSIWKKSRSVDSTPGIDTSVEYASREDLLSYDSGRDWFYVKDSTKLVSVAGALESGNYDYLCKLMKEGLLKRYRSIKQIPGNDFIVVYFEDAYVLGPYILS